MIKKSRFWEDTHGTGRSHVALPYPVPRVHFSADRTDTSVIVREVLGCLNALVCRPNRYMCTKRPPPGEEKSILGGLQGAGACSRPRGSPGQHARLWVSRCRLLKRRSSIVGGRSIFSNLQHPPGEQDDPRCAGSGGRTQGCRRLFWAGINMVLVA